MRVFNDISRRYILLVFALFMLLGECCYDKAILASQVSPLINTREINQRNLSFDNFISFEGSSAGYYGKNESNYLFKGVYIFSLSKKNSKENLIINADILGYTGIYRVYEIEGYNGSYPYYGFGPAFYACLQFPIEKLRLGIGIYTGTAYEWGDFSKFRQNAADKGLIYKETEKFPALFSIYPILRYRYSANIAFAFQVAFGTPGFISPNLSVSIANVDLWASALPLFTSGKLYSIGLAYKLF